MREFQMQADMEVKAGVTSKTIVPKDEEGAMKGQQFFLSQVRNRRMTLARVLWWPPRCIPIWSRLVLSALGEILT